MGSCAQCGGKSYLVERKGDRLMAKVCPCQEPCRLCGGSGHRFTTQEETFSAKVGARRYEVLVPCTCRLLRRRVELLSSAELPGIYTKASFDSWSAVAPRPEAAAALDRARQTAMKFALGYSKANPSRGFVLSGPTGTGKTHLLVAALSHLTLEMGISTRYAEISLLYATIRRGFQLGKSGGEIIGPLAEVEVVAIDELGKGRGSQFEQETLDELIARRYNAGRTTLFASNYSLEGERKPTKSPSGYRSSEELKGAAKDSELLRDRVGERIYSRLCEMCEFVEFPSSTPDRRQVHAYR